MTFANDSGYPDSEVFGDVALTSGSVSPAYLLDASLPLSGGFPVDAADPSGRSFYFCLGAGASGRFWISLASPISGLPSVQPTVTAPYRFGYVEFTYPGVVDYSNVNDFDFPVNLRTFVNPGDSIAQAEAAFSGTTCQIVAAMKSAATQAGGGADWNTIEQTDSNGNFVRIASEVNDLPANGGWPSMTAYITGFMDSLPLVGSGPHAGEHGPFTVEDHYATTPAFDSQNDGWFDYQGYFDSTGFLTLDGSLGSPLQPGVAPSVPEGATMSISENDLALGIYDQGHEYAVNGSQDLNNDVYARIWNDLTGAFDFGYWGSSLGNGSDTRYFFGTFPAPGTTSPTGGQPAFPPSRTAAFGPAPGGVPYNLYSEVLSRYSPDYTLPFGENYGAGGSGISPLIGIPGGGEIRMTLPSDGWGATPSSPCVGSASGTTSTTTTSPTSTTAAPAPSTTTSTAAPAPSTTTTTAAPAPSTTTTTAAPAPSTTTTTSPVQPSPSPTGSAPVPPSTTTTAPAAGATTTTTTTTTTTSSTTTIAAPGAPGSTGSGYWLLGDGGSVYPFGSARNFNEPPLSGSWVALAGTPDGGGLWIVNSAGDVKAFGDARTFDPGSVSQSPVVAMSATQDGTGLLLATSDGQVMAIGDAVERGSPADSKIKLNSPIVDMVTTSDDHGYWLLGGDGGVFAFGDAAFLGSAASIHLNAPAVALCTTPEGRGYQIASADGGVFAFGDAAFLGSLGGMHLAGPVDAMTSTGDGGGYVMAASDGGVFSFGSARFAGALAGIVHQGQIIAIARP